MKKWFKVFCAGLLLSAMFAGCSAQTGNEGANSEQTEATENNSDAATDTANDQAKDAENASADELDVEKETIRINAAIKLADERLLGATEPKQVGDGDAAKTYNVVKEKFADLEALKAYYESVYTPEYADQVMANYVSTVDGVGTVVTLPEDFVNFKGLTKDEITITIEGEKATAVGTVDGKTVTYELVNKDGKWYVASKTVQ